MKQFVNGFDASRAFCLTACLQSSTAAVTIVYSYFLDIIQYDGHCARCARFSS